MRIYEIELHGDDLESVAAFSEWLKTQSEKQFLKDSFIHWCIVRTFGNRECSVVTRLFASTWDMEILAQYCTITDRPVPSVDYCVLVKCIDIPQRPGAFSEVFSEVLAPKSAIDASWSATFQRWWKT